MDVTTSFLGSGVLSFVPEIQNMLAGQALAVMLDGMPVTTAKLGDDHAFCWGWHPAIAATGAQRGDVLRITVDVGAKTAELQVGGAGTLELCRTGRQFLAPSPLHGSKLSGTPELGPGRRCHELLA
jgi:hypothetical protein